MENLPLKISVKNQRTETAKINTTDQM